MPANKPCRADQEQDGLAPPRRLVECAPPTLAGSDTPSGVKVQERVVPALANEPMAQCNSWCAFGRRRGTAQGPWTDIYAVAPTLYFALTGKAPPDAADRQIEDDLSKTHNA
jgi:hypothetical protein